MLSRVILNHPKEMFPQICLFRKSRKYDEIMIICHKYDSMTVLGSARAQKNITLFMDDPLELVLK